MGEKSTSAAVVVPMLRKSALLLVSCFSMCAPALSANAACINFKDTNSLSFEGSLSYRIFAGPPNYEDVRKGDTPEPAYILTLNAPICATGDESLDPQQSYDNIQC